MANKSLLDRSEIRLAGEGGQGMILAGIILAEAAAIFDGKNTAQTQSYGPEARGGASKAEVIIAVGEIDHPEVISADVLVAMSQEACDKYAGNLKKTGFLIVDEEKVGRVPSTKAIKVPITRLAQESSGKTIQWWHWECWLAGLCGPTRRSRKRAGAPKEPQMNVLALNVGFEVAGT
jgi:2-oxoglutarate ferredoxin oxidoreductase subunit gamma